MLSDEQRRAIEDEETLRHEVRRKLEAATPSSPAPAPTKPGFGKRLFEFFNSALGMWLLSSVVLTGGAAMLQRIQHDHETAQKDRQTVVQHRFEITNRLDEMQYALRRAQTVGQAQAALDGMYRSRAPLAPELQNRSLASMFLTLTQMLEGTEQQRSEKALAFVRYLEEAEFALHQHADGSAALDGKQKAHLHKLIASIKALHLRDPQNPNPTIDERPGPDGAAARPAGQMR